VRVKNSRAWAPVRRESGWARFYLDLVARKPEPDLDSFIQVRIVRKPLDSFIQVRVVRVRVKSCRAWARVRPRFGLARFLLHRATQKAIQVRVT